MRNHVRPLNVTIGLATLALVFLFTMYTISPQHASVSGPAMAMPLGGEAAPTVPAPIDFFEIDLALQRLSIGGVEIKVPNTMTLGEAYQVSLLLSPTSSMSDIEEKIRERLGEREGLREVQIEIAPGMASDLSGQNVEVEPLTPQGVKEVGLGHDVEWRWKVKPTRAGNTALRFELAVILSIDGHRLPRPIRVFDRTVEVRPAPRQ